MWHLLSSDAAPRALSSKTPTTSSPTAEPTTSSFQSAPTSSSFQSAPVYSLRYHDNPSSSRTGYESYDPSKLTLRRSLRNKPNKPKYKFWLLHLSSYYCHNKLAHYNSVFQYIPYYIKMKYTVFLFYCDSYCLLWWNT